MRSVELSEKFQGARSGEDEAIASGIRPLTSKNVSARAAKATETRGQNEVATKSMLWRVFFFQGEPLADRQQFTCGLKSEP